MSGRKQNKNEIEKQTIQLKETWLNPGPLLDVNNNWMKSSITLTPERYVWYIMYYNVWDNRGINLLLNEKCEFWWPANEWRENGQINPQVNQVYQCNNESCFPTRVLGREFHNPSQIMIIHVTTS